MSNSCDMVLKSTRGSYLFRDNLLHLSISLKNLTAARTTPRRGTTSILALSHVSMPLTQTHHREKQLTRDSLQQQRPRAIRQTSIDWLDKVAGETVGRVCYHRVNILSSVRRMQRGHASVCRECCHCFPFYLRAVGGRWDAATMKRKLCNYTSWAGREVDFRLPLFCSVLRSILLKQV